MLIRDARDNSISPNPPLPSMVAISLALAVVGQRSKASSLTALTKTLNARIVVKTVHRGRARASHIFMHQIHYQLIVAGVRHSVGRLDCG
jgi:hypothetical protein